MQCRVSVPRSLAYHLQTLLAIDRECSIVKSVQDVRLQNNRFRPPFGTRLRFRRVKSSSFLNFLMLKSCRNFEHSERSKVWKLGAFETVDFLSSLSNLRQRFLSVRRFESSEISKIWKQSLSEVRTQRFQKTFDVEHSEISTSNAFRFRCRTLGDFHVERSEISTLNARKFDVERRRFRRRTLGDSDSKVLTL